MIGSLKGAVDLLARAGVMTVVPSGTCPSLLDEIIGERVRGSWWAHPKGREVYAVLSALDEHPDVLVTKLVDGKNTLVHRSLWPDFLRLVLDEGWRTRAVSRLNVGGRAIVGRVEEAGEVRADALPASMRGARSKTAQSLLVHSHQAHTESGKHELVFVAWRRWAKEHGAAPNEAPFADALAALEQRAGRLAVFRERHPP